MSLWVTAQSKLSSHPLLGNTAMARGSSKLLLTRTLRLVPSRRATSMVLRPVSVQYMFLATQSTASPSVVFRPWLITVSMPLPSRFARLKDKVKNGQHDKVNSERIYNINVHRFYSDLSFWQQTFKGISQSSIDKHVFNLMVFLLFFSLYKFK